MAFGTNKRLGSKDIEQKQQEKICTEQNPESQAQLSKFFPNQSHTGHAFSLASNQRGMFRKALFESQGPRLL